MRRFHAITVALVFMFVAPLLTTWTPARAQDATPAADCPATTEEDNQAIVMAWYDAIDAGDVEAFDDVLAPVVVQHAADFADAQGIEDVKTNFAPFIAAFPDIHHEIDQVVTDDDFVAVRAIGQGTHQGDFSGIPATGNEVTWSSLAIYRIECGKIAEHWSEVDAIGRLRQLGAFEMPAGSSRAAAPNATPHTLMTDAGAAVSTPAACPDTTEEENEALVRRWYDEVYNQANFDNIGQMMASEYTKHGVLDRDTTTAQEQEEDMRENRTALPDLGLTVELILTDGDRVAARWTASGTHEGPWVGVEPTGATITWTGNTIFRIECGRLTEQWSESDTLSVFEQLGVIEWPPTDSVASPAAD